MYTKSNNDAENEGNNVDQMETESKSPAQLWKAAMNDIHASKNLPEVLYPGWKAVHITIWQRL